MEEQGQQLTETQFREACVPANPRLGHAMVLGVEGPRAGVLLAECLAQFQCDLGLGFRGRVAGERKDVPGSRCAGELSH